MFFPGNLFLVHEVSSLFMLRKCPPARFACLQGYNCCVARYGHVILNGLFSATCVLWMSKLAIVVYGYY